MKSIGTQLTDQDRQDNDRQSEGQRLAHKTENAVPREAVAARQFFRTEFGMITHGNFGLQRSLGGAVVGLRIDLVNYHYSDFLKP